MILEESQSTECPPLETGRGNRHRREVYPILRSLFDSQFDSLAWRGLSLCRDAEAMRIAVVVGKEKLGLTVVSMFDF